MSTSHIVMLVCILGVFDVSPTSAQEVPATPLANTIFDVLGNTKACVTDADCKAGETGPNPETVCRDSDGDDVADQCYVMRQRYLSVKPNAANAGLMYAIRVSLDTGESGVVPLGYAQSPVFVSAGANNGPASYDRATIGDSPFYRDWTTLDSGILSIGDCEVSPNHTYRIQAISDGDDTDDESRYSGSLILSTPEFSGDVTGGGSPGDPPNGAPGTLTDVFAQIIIFQSNGNEPMDWGDTDPATGSAVPNLIVSIADYFQTIQAFQGNPFPGPAPLDCP